VPTPDQPTPAPHPEHPADIAIGFRDGAIVARNLSGSPAGDHALERLGFTPRPGTALRTLTGDVDPRSLRERAGAAIRLLRTTGYQVSADHGLDPALDPPPASPPPSRSSVRADGPDVAFARHPHLGIAAATRGNTLGVAAVLTEHGFVHQPGPDIYLLPPTLPDHMAVLTTIRAARHLDNLGHTVALDPRVYASVVIKVTAQAPELRPPGKAPGFPPRPPEPPSPGRPRTHPR
jgi:hypothetical protein